VHCVACGWGGRSSAAHDDPTWLNARDHALSLSALPSTVCCLTNNLGMVPPRRGSKWRCLDKVGRDKGRREALHASRHIGRADLDKHAERHSDPALTVGRAGGAQRVLIRTVQCALSPHHRPGAYVGRPGRRSGRCPHATQCRRSLLWHSHAHEHAHSTRTLTLPPAGTPAHAHTPDRLCRMIGAVSRPPEPSR
jgi:hypothetical protein